MSTKPELKVNRKIESVKPAKTDEGSQNQTEQSPGSLYSAINSVRSDDPRIGPAARRDAILRLQQTYGNRAVQRMLKRDNASIQRDPVAIASLGVAVFSAGQTIVNGGGFSCTSNTPSFLHPNTPATAQWENVSEELHIQAIPVSGFGTEDFYFRLSYERNGNDIRNAVVNALKDKSSTMIASSFTINWGGQAQSSDSAPVSEIVFNISNSLWDPAGPGQYSFWGQLIISASKEAARHTAFNITSEENYVWVAT